MYDYLGLNSDYVYNEYAPPLIDPIQQISVEGGSVVVTINGASGPNIDFTSSVGFTFTGNLGGTINMDGVLLLAKGGTGATTAVAARANLGAAEAGINSDITMFDGLSGVGGWSAWTGSSDKSSHATYSATADAAYNQTQVQALMDKVKELTETVKALIDTHLGSGVLET